MGVEEGLQVNIPNCYHFGDLLLFSFLVTTFSNSSPVNMESNDAKHPSFNQAKCS